MKKIMTDKQRELKRLRDARYRANKRAKLAQAGKATNVQVPAICRDGKKNPLSKPGKGQTKAHPFAVCEFAVRGCACKGGKDKSAKCCIDFYDFKLRKHHLICVCTISKVGEKNAKVIAGLLNHYAAKGVR